MKTYPPQVETFTLRREDDSPLKFEGELLAKTGKCEIVRDAAADNIFGHDFNLRTSLRLFKTVGGKFVGAVEEWDDTNCQYGLRHAVFADRAAELFEAPSNLWSAFLRDGEITTGAVDGDILRELFANAGLSGEIPAVEPEQIA